MLRHFAARIFPSLISAVFLATYAQAQWTAPNPVTGFEKQPDGVVFHMKTGTLRLTVCTPLMIHLVYSPTSSSRRTSIPL